MPAPEGKVVNHRSPEPYDVYIGRDSAGRAGVTERGLFGNPVKVGAVCETCGQRHTAGGSTLRCYRKYLDERTARDPVFRTRLLALRGKTLECFCPQLGGWTLADPIACHGQIILQWLRDNPE